MGGRKIVNCSFHNYLNPWNNSAHTFHCHYVAESSYKETEYWKMTHAVHSAANGSQLAM